VHVRRPELVLAAAVAICLPMVPGILNGSVNTTTAGARFLGALVICWVGGSVISWIIDRYTAEARRSQVVKMLAATRKDRRADAVPPDQPGG